MIRVLMIAGLASALLACAATPPPPPTADGGCDVTVKFGSYGAGIDHGLAQILGWSADGDDDLARVERRPWGREGEFDLCLAVKPGRDARAIYARYRAQLPPKGQRGPTTILGPGGLSHEIPGGDPPP